MAFYVAAGIFLVAAVLCGSIVRGFEVGSGAQRRRRGTEAACASSPAAGA